MDRQNAFPSAALAAPGDPMGSGLRQVGLAIAATAGLLLLWIEMPLVVLPAALPVALLGLVLAATQPALLCIIFLTLTYFKVNEILPVLAPLGYVLSLGSALTTFALVWHVIFARSIRPELRGPQGLVALLWLFVSFGLLAAQDHSIAYQAWSDYSKTLLLALAVLCFLRSKEQVCLLARLFIIGGVTLSVSTIYNSLHGIGLVEDTRAAAGLPGIGTLSNPNDLALILLLPLALAAAMIVNKVSAGGRLLAIVGIAFIAWAIILTQSRGGLLGVLAVFTIIGSRFIKSKGLMVCIGLILAAVLYSAMGIADRESGGAADTKGESAQDRIYAWRAGTNMAAAYPLTGVGIGNFPTQFPIYTPEETQHPLTAHSIWFLVLGEVGVPGFLTFVALVCTCFIAGFRNMRRLTEKAVSRDLLAVAHATIGGLAGYLVSGSFLSYVYQWPLYVLVTLTVTLTHLAQQPSHKSI